MFDLAILDSGSGAFAAGIRATHLGKRVLMIERGTIGGGYVNTDCVLSKALLAAADAAHRIGFGPPCRSSSGSAAR